MEVEDNKINLSNKITDEITEEVNYKETFEIKNFLMNENISKYFLLIL